MATAIEQAVEGKKKNDNMILVSSGFFLTGGLSYAVNGKCEAECIQLAKNLSLNKKISPRDCYENLKLVLSVLFVSSAYGPCMFTLSVIEQCRNF